MLFVLLYRFDNLRRGSRYNAPSLREALGNDTPGTHHCMVTQYNSGQDYRIHANPAFFAEYNILSGHMDVWVVYGVVGCNQTDIGRYVAAFTDRNACINSLKIYSETLEVIDIGRIEIYFVSCDMYISANRPGDMPVVIE